MKHAKYRKWRRLPTNPEIARALGTPEIDGKEVILGAMGGNYRRWRSLYDWSVSKPGPVKRIK